MFNKTNAKKNLVGLDIGSSSIKAVELQKKGNSYHLVNLGFENLSHFYTSFKQKYGMTPAEINTKIK